MQIRAAIVKKTGDPFVIENVELDEPLDGEMLVKITASGICHTDELARIQALPVPLPAVLGHEGCGIVEAVGAGVKEFEPGDRVTFSFASCGKCASCLGGWPTTCESFPSINFGGAQPDGSSRLSQGGKMLATMFGQSSFAEYVVANERCAVKVPDDVPLEIAGPLGCGIQTGAGAVWNRLRPRPGSSIAVFGCGSVGLSAIMAAKIVGCGTIVAVDRTASRLDMAKELGATHVVSTENTSDAAKEIHRLTGLGADCAVDTTGNGLCTRMALQCTKAGSSTAVVGGGGDMTLNVEHDLMSVSKSLIGIVEGDSNPKVFIPELMEHYTKGRFPFDRLITYYDFDSINEAMADCLSGKAIKAVLRMSAR
ncbi:MAG: NAD(P)-dependent alcohol dehydrogenase [Oscillospiraceae bacterium]|nr:NAD(P)-dependent alcohol dehydrogenase [Oscillospiraceae bacterium]